MSDHSPYDLVVRAVRAVTGAGEVACAVAVADSRIVAIGGVDEPWAAYETVELGSDVVLLPGLVDTHVHLQDPGDGWEDFTHGTAAAAAGGVTTVVDMPLDSVPVTTSVVALDAKRATAAGRCHVDVGFWGGITPGNVAGIGPLHAAGVLGFKCFLGETGNTAFPPLTVEELAAAMRETARLDVPLVVHAEFTADRGSAHAGKIRTYREYLATHPTELEDAAVAAVLDTARITGARAHVAHLSSGDAVPALAAARAAGVRVTVETCAHYLTLSAEEIPDGATGFKVCPPIRDQTHRERLWDALREGVIDLVVSDHSPGPPAVGGADGDFAARFGGIAGLQVSLPLVWTEARRLGFTLVDVARWLASEPAALAGLDNGGAGGGKGRIAVGFDADFCVFAPDETFVVDPAEQRSRQVATPYAGRTLRGVVRRTWLRGRPVTADRPHGRLLTRPIS